jgi:hypothetical protein
MEPITALELTGWAEEFLLKNRTINLPIYRDVTWEDYTRPIENPDTRPFYVTITTEVLIRNGQRHLMLFAKDEESALLLESVFLPGQRRALRDAEGRAETRGAMKFLEALSSLRK